jgi:hypothetical protein
VHSALNRVVVGFDPHGSISGDSFLRVARRILFVDDLRGTIVKLFYLYFYFLLQAPLV